MFEFALTGITPYNRSVYFSLLQDYNLMMWPTHIIAIFVALSISFMLIKAEPKAVRILLSILGVSWMIVGYFFFLKTYISINWAGKYFAYVFIMQGFLFLFCGCCFKVTIINVSKKWLANTLHSVLIVFLLFYPLAGLIDGRNSNQLEVFALSPDITVLFSLMFLVLLKNKWKYILLPVPILWLVISISSAITLQLIHWQLMLALLILWGVLVLINLKGRTSKR